MACRGRCVAKLEINILLFETINPSLPRILPFDSNSYLYHGCIWSKFCEISAISRNEVQCSMKLWFHFLGENGQNACLAQENTSQDRQFNWNWSDIFTASHWYVSIIYLTSKAAKNLRSSSESLLSSSCCVLSLFCDKPLHEKLLYRNTHKSNVTWNPYNVFLIHWYFILFRNCDNVLCKYYGAIWNPNLGVQLLLPFLFGILL